MSRPALTWPHRLAGGAAIVVAIWLCAFLWANVNAADLYDGDVATQRLLADNVAARVTAHGTGPYLKTGSIRFDGQSMIAIDQMAILGLGQIILDHPELRDAYLPAMRASAARLVDPRTLSYAALVYGHHGVVGSLGSGHAYLGYINMGLGMLRLIEPDNPYAAVHDRISLALARHLDANRHGMIETYPGETWPPDVAAVAGSIGLHAQATGTDHRALLDRWAKRFAACAIHPSGYLVQRLQTGTCKPLDKPRGSGTAVAAYFTSFAHRDLSARLHRAVADPGAGHLFGFAAVREFPPGVPEGTVDINAGPVLFGFSVGATGFALGSARAHGDRDLYLGLYRSASAIGGRIGGGRSFASGGLLGDALLLAMLTARSP